MTERFLAVVNPAAGGGKSGRRAPAAIDRLREQGLDIDVAMTSRAGEATDVVRREWSEGRTRFIGVGGDGTGYEIVNGLFPEAGDGDRRPQLGFLPLGTGNSFLRDFTDQGVAHSSRALASGKSRACDVIRLKHRDGVLHYINILSIGFVADVNGLRQTRFRSYGEFGYVLAVVTKTAGLESMSFPMRLDGGPLEREPAVFYSFNNSKFTGGKMMMAPGADTADGKIALVRVGQMGRMSLLGAFPRIFAGTHLSVPGVSERKVSTVDFEMEQPIDVMVDGEALELVPERLDVLPGAFDVFA
jgi:diacylglycerol kinase (ATP)